MRRALLPRHAGGTSAPSHGAREGKHMAMTNRPAPVPRESTQPVPSARETAAAQRQLRRVTGISAILTAVAGTVVGDLYFAYSGNPPQWDVLTRSLLNLVTRSEERRVRKESV